MSNFTGSGTLTTQNATAINGTVVIENNGTLTYTPNVGYTGSDTITFEVNDSAGGVATDTVAVTVNSATPQTAGRIVFSNGFLLVDEPREVLQSKFFRAGVQLGPTLTPQSTFGTKKMGRGYNYGIEYYFLYQVADGTWYQTPVFIP